jgi:hypothetical protein
LIWILKKRTLSRFYGVLVERSQDGTIELLQTALSNVFLVLFKFEPDNHVNFVLSSGKQKGVIDVNKADASVRVKQARHSLTRWKAKGLKLA